MIAESAFAHEINLRVLHFFRERSDFWRGIMRSELASGDMFGAALSMEGLDKAQSELVEYQAEKLNA